MNKKFSTLVAALLVSGGLAYTVNAMMMPAAEGAAQTYVTAIASQDGITGYTLAIGTTGTSGWSLVSNGAEGFYLSPATGWFLAADGTVKKVEGNTLALATVDAGVLKVGGKSVSLVDGVVTMDAATGEALNLFDGEGIVSALAVKGSLTFATAKNVNVDLAQTNQLVAGVTITAPVPAFGEATTFAIADYTKFTVVKRGGSANPNDLILSVKTADEITYYLKAGANEGDAVTFVRDAEEASVVAAGTGGNESLITLGEKVLNKKTDGTLISAGSGIAVRALIYEETTVAALTALSENGDIYLGALASISSIESDNISAITIPNRTIALTNPAKLSTALNAAGEEANTWTLAEGKLSIAGQYLKVDGNGFILTATSGEAATFKYVDGVLMQGNNPIYVTESGLSTVNSGTDNNATLHAVSTNAITATPASEIGNGTTFVIAELKTVKAAKDCIVATAKQAAEPGAPGGEFGTIDGVTIKEDGILEITASGVEDIPAPVYVAIGSQTDKYLSVVDGKIVLTEKPSSSWVLEGGHFYNLDLLKQGAEKIWLSGTLTRSTATGFDLVTDLNNALSVSSTPTGFVIGDQPATLSLSNQSFMAAEGTEANPRLDAVGTDYVYVGDGANYFTAAANGTMSAIAGAELWSVKTTKLQDGRMTYSFVSRTDKSKVLTIDGATKFAGVSYDKGVQLVAIDGVQGNLVIGGTNASLETDGAQATSIGFYRSKLVQFNAEYLIHRLGSSFNLELMDKKDGEKDLKGNVFAGADVVPMVIDERDADGIKSLKPATKSTELTFVFKKGDNYIVLDLDTKWGNITDQVVNGGYKFTVLNETNLLKVLNGETINGHNYAPYFRINYLQGTTEAGDKITETTPIYTIQVSQAVNFNNANLPNLNLVTFEINSGDQKGVYLTADSRETNKVYATFTTQNIVHGSQADNNPLNMKYVTIEFANHSSVTYQYNGTISLNGKVLGTGIDKENGNRHPMPADKDNFLFAKPEGQWAVSMTNATGNLKEGVELNSDTDTQFTFTNRESGIDYRVEKMHYLGDSKYAVEYSKNSIPSIEPFASGASRDTLIIKPAAALKNDTIQMDGYANWKAADVQDELYRLVVASKQNSYYVTENHSKDSHFLGLDQEVGTAVNWRIVPMTETRKWDSDGVLKTASDSVYIFNAPQKYTGGKYYAHQDTLAIVSYALQNVDNGEYLTYEPTQSTTILSMICDPNSKGYTTSKDLASAYRFILKEKADGLYNLIGTTGAYYDANGYVTSLDANASINLDKKLYGATTYQKNGAVEVEYAYTQINSNDLFKVEEVDAPRYRKVAQADTIRMFRAENDFDTMYENGEFLNLGNSAQLKDMAPALYVDTAYVDRGTNNRYQYLMVVNPVRKDAVYDNANHLIKPDTTYGRFLVNLIDSAVYTYRSGVTHNNKYINDKEADRTEVKLGFVWGYRTANTLFLTDGADFTTVKSKIDLNTRDFNIAKFAFRFIKPESNDPKGAFKIQTRYVDYNSAIAVKDQKDRTETNEGYLKTINGVVVVTNSFANGEEFNLAAEASAPTSNDQIGTSEVSVIAGVGSVVVKNAAGKSVAISNILGQTIATTVLTSDNATIAVPAGIVVVTVEGEEAVKTVVR